MRISKRIITIVLGMFLVGSCETDFSTTTDWEDITVVYGLLNQNDSVYFLKINKAFLGEGNKLIYAQEADSSQYPFPLEVKIEEFSENNQLVQTIIFDTSKVYNKEPGTFYYPDQIIYKGIVDEPYDWDYVIVPPNDTIEQRPVWLNESSTYRLSIVYPDSSKIISSNTHLVDDFRITNPSSYSGFIKFTPNPSAKTIFRWDKAKKGGRNEFTLVFNYREFENDTKDTVDRQIILSKGESSSGESYYYKDNNFYASCINNIPYQDAQKESNVLARFTESVEVIVSVAESELSLYMDVYEPSTSIVQEKPTYTNIENGIGIFSARYQKTRKKKLHPESVIYLKEIMEPNLKFVY